MELKETKVKLNISDSDEKDTVTPKTNAKIKIIEFCNETSAHGLAHTVQSNTSLIWKIIWICICVFAGSGAGFHLFSSINLYLEYPVQKVSTLVQKPIKFPEVSFCNQVPISPGSLQVERNNTNSGYSSFQSQINDTTGFNELYRSISQINYSLSDLLHSQGILYSNVNHSELSQIGHSLRDMVLYCSYGGVACDMDLDFKQFLSPVYLNCFTFTGKSSVGKSSIGSGPSNGLSLILFLDSTDLLDNSNDHGHYNIYSNVENMYGLRFEVHSNGEFPNPRDSGFDIMPGESTSIALNVERGITLNHPYGNCTTGYKIMGGYEFSQGRCVDSCLAKYIYSTCNCISDLYLVDMQNSGQKSRTSGDKFCLKFDGNATKFFGNFQCQFESQLLFSRSAELKKVCNCLPLCANVYFNKVISQSVWPGKRYIHDMLYEVIYEHQNASSLKAYTQVNYAYDNNFTANALQGYVYDNFARVNIYFESTSILEHTERPSFPQSSLWSDIGGTIGLWAGLSVITVIEFISLILQLLGLVCRKARKAIKHK